MGAGKHLVLATYGNGADGVLDRIVIDLQTTISRAGLELEDLIERKNNHPTTSFIFHSTKDGKFRGENNLAHEVDVIIEIEPGLAKASGRFNAGGEMEF